MLAVYHMVHVPNGMFLRMSRQQLLEKVLAHVRHNGVIEQSLREIAESIGSSHRMLLYHFGSREGLLTEIVAVNEAGERMAAELAARSDSAVDALRTAWNRLRDPGRAGDERLFFELAAMAMYGRPGTERVAADMVHGWMAEAEKHGADPSVLRLDIAVIRGLLLDLLLSGDHDGTDRAFDRFLAMRPG